jgi:hypothetical protein
MVSANELANTKKLSRKTCSVTRDSKRDQLIIVEEISETGKENPRSDVYYFFYQDVATTEVNDILSEAKSRATVAFLGLDDTKGVETVDAPVATEEKVAEKPAPKVSKKKVSAKKAAAKKPAAKVVEPELDITPEEFEVAIQQVEAEAVDDLLPDDAPETVLYDKANREHATFLRPVVVEALGKDWKKDEASMTKVRSLIAKLNGKVEVSDVEGNVLPAFHDTAKAMIA